MISIHFFLVLNLFQYFHSPSQNLLLDFSPCLCLAYLEKSFLFGLQKRRKKTEKLCCAFFNFLLGKANTYSYFQHVYQRSCSFCYNVLHFYFYIFENLIDIIIFLDIILSLIGALFQYLFLSYFTSLRYFFWHFP